MTFRRLTAAALTTVSLVLGSATTAAGSSDPVARESSDLVARWDMNESRGSRSMKDASGHGLNGLIGREVSAGVRVDGATGYRFSRLQPDDPPAHPQHLAVVADRGPLDPGDRDFAVTVRLRTTYRFGNVIQKGQATVAGGSFKLQIPSGILQCMFRGSGGTLLVQSPRPLNDGRWHTVRCDRTEAGLSLAVDGSTVARRSGWTGWISNSWPLTIGGKTDCNQIDVGCDYYAGDLDYVSIDAY